eukprot:3566708-Lingulodinium_polyedra.AAC.1
MQCNAMQCNPIQSNPIQSNPIQSSTTNPQHIHNNTSQNQSVDSGYQDWALASRLIHFKMASA